jgi:hypothetical protein
MIGQMEAGGCPPSGDFAGGPPTAACRRCLMRLRSQVSGVASSDLDVVLGTVK